MRSPGAFGLILGILGGVASAQWTQTGAGLTGSVPGVTALVIDGFTGSTLYALTSANSVFKVFKSIDGGANWTSLGNIAGVNVLAVDPTSASTIYAGTATGVMTSTDGGDSWASAGLTGTPIGVLAVDPITPSTLYAGGNGHLYKSTDQAATWTELNLGPRSGNGQQSVRIVAVAIDPLTPSTLYAAMESGLLGNILKSLDGGETWNVIYPNAGPFYDISSNLVIDPSNPSTLYRVNPFRKSTDGGITWTSAGFAQFIAALAIDPRDSNTLYLSTINNSQHAIFKSTDGGESWNQVDMSVPATVAFVLSPDSSLYAATGAGVFKSADAGVTWGELDTGLRLFDIDLLVGDPVDPATIYAGGNDGLFRSVDGGGSWSPLAIFHVTSSTPPFPPVSPAGVRSLYIDFTNPAVLYVSLARSAGNFSTSTDVTLAKSTDGGATWDTSIAAEVKGGDVALLAMDPTDANTLYLRTGDDYGGYILRRSTDGGVTWNFTGLGGLNGLTALVIDPTTPATLYAATASTNPEGDSVIGGVQKSTDAGATWSVVGLTNQDVGLLAIDPLQPSVLYAVVSQYEGCCFQGLFKSADNGAAWSRVNNGLDNLIAAGVNVNALVVDPDHPGVLYLATSGYGVFKSSDGGATWAAFIDGLSFLDVRALAIVRGASPTLYAATPGGIFQILIGEAHQ